MDTTKLKVSSVSDELEYSYEWVREVHAKALRNIEI